MPACMLQLFSCPDCSSENLLQLLFLSLFCTSVYVTAIIFKVALNCLSRPNNKSALEMLFTIQNTHRDNHSGMSKEHFNLILLRNSLVKQYLDPLLLVELR